MKKILVSGRNGSGKTEKILFNETKLAINNNENIVFLDFKEEYYKTFGRELKEKGYDVLVLNFKNCSCSNAWNPFKLIKHYYDLKEFDFVNTLLSSMAKEIFRGDKNSDPYWTNVAKDYFVGLSTILLENASESELNIGSIYTLSQTGLKNFSQTETYLQEYVRILGLTSQITISLTPVIDAPIDTKGSILSVFNNNLNEIINKPQLLNLLCTDEINLSKLKEKTAIFIISDHKNKLVSKMFLNIFIETMLKENNNFTYILDDFEILDYLESFKDLLLSNSKIVTACNNKEELKEIYGNNIVNMFTIELEPKEDIKDIEVGNYNEYPNLEMNKHDYFNIEKLFHN